MEGTIGEIRMFGGSFAPRGWQLCQGQVLPISTYDTVYTILGTTYGGDGVNTFALPGLGGRIAIGTGQGSGTSNYYLGMVTGTENVTLLTPSTPAHNHAASVTTDNVAVSATATLSAATSAGSSTPANCFLGTDGAGAFYTNTGTLVPLASNTITVTGFTGPAATVSLAPVGGTQPHNNIQPYTTVNYIICLEGIFPSRN
jgi:microcystin-dependent protein